MKKHLLIIALAENQGEAVCLLSQLVSQAGSEIAHMRMSQLLQNQTAIYLHSFGSWDAIAKLEASLNAAKKKYGLELVTRHIEPEKAKHPELPYILQVFAFQDSEVIQLVSKYLLEQDVKILELSVDQLPQTDEDNPLYSLTINMRVPLFQSINELRENLMLLSEDLNVDTILEPVKSL